MSQQQRPASEEHFQIEEDPRFAVCLKEAKISFTFFAAFFVAVMVAMYTLGDQLVLGLPAWFLAAGIVIPIVFIGILYYLVEYVFEDTPLEEEGGGSQ